MYLVFVRETGRVVLSIEDNYRYYVMMVSRELNLLIDVNYVDMTIN